MATKDMKKESDVYLIDHAWTFQYNDAYNTLLQNEKLIERLEKLTEFSEKQEIPNVTNEEEAKKDPVVVFKQCLDKGGRVFELSNLGIESLKDFEWPETLEELDLMGNEVYNPNDIATYICPLPNIKAMWFNGCPVAEQCSNFTSIADSIPSLQIINSKFTNNAGEWAILFYGRASGAKTLEEIESLNLAGRGLTYVKDADLFDRLTSLKRLDISDHPEFFMCQEKVEALQFQSTIGINQEDKKGVTWVGQSHNIVDVLPKFKTLEELICDKDLEEYIIENRSKLNILPNLKTVNGISLTVTDMEVRAKHQRVMNLMKDLPQYINQYMMGQGELAMPVWYVQDEVGSAIVHSDKANVKVFPFIYSPNSSAQD